jgi:hypothetical protein
MSLIHIILIVAILAIVIGLNPFPSTPLHVAARRERIQRQERLRRLPKNN